MQRQYPPTPIPSVGAIVLKNDKILLVLRGQEPSRGKWSIPGGIVEPGETIREAVRREVLEECGVEIEVGDVVEVLDAIIRDQDGRVQYHYILIDLLATYVTEEELPGFDVTKGALPVIRKALRKQNLDFSTQRR